MLCEYFLDFLAFLSRILMKMIEYTTDLNRFFFVLIVLYKNPSENRKYFILVCYSVSLLNKNIENLLKKAMILSDSAFFIFNWWFKEITSVILED